jgi:hypothetical protein
MILSAAQPYFAPHAGFFGKILKSDVFVLLDRVQFPRGGTWMTRNRFKNDRGTLWIRLPVHRKGRGLQRIDQVRIVREEGAWAGKHLTSLQTAYRHGPFFADHFGPLRDRLASDIDSLVELNISLIEYVGRQLGAETRIVRLSETGVDSRGEALLLDLCRYYRADVLLAQSAARKFLDPAPFARSGVRLDFIQTKVCVYPQLWGRFVGNLSVFDLLFCCGPKARAIIEQTF